MRHCSHIFFTDVRTFTVLPSNDPPLLMLWRDFNFNHYVLYRKTIRPRVKSYGDNSKATLSPGTILI